MAATSRNLAQALVLGVGRPVFRLLERVAPNAGGTLVRRLWCTPPRAYLPPGEPLPPGRRSTVAVKAGQAAVEEWGDGPTVYLLHGWGGRRGDLDAFVAPLVAAGLRAVAIDVPGHGAAGAGRFGGRRTVLTEFSDTVAAVVAANGPAFGIIGHSAGATAAAVSVLDGTPASRLALIAPMGRLQYYTGQFRTAFGYGDRVEAQFHRQLEVWSGRPHDDWDIAGYAADRDGLPPVLVVHDEKDRRNPAAHGEAIARAWPGAELRLTTGLGHSRILRDPTVVKSVVTYFTDALDDLGS
ncbi:hypothetical protein Val02_55640 [Virgisporangium aliadipatigenens]|uniref:AB hydrolase-1 domain-containing protein n=1 Tax=Virgisporangium aliadipatigenens TaxID=741659 RepID=A0A8J3YQW3_9ACTN|nr:alpha/beta hydrolase [Virgisporangium aliadipatigenens]GIJ48678.1 hypothetical protein Val02_55640 [Virgisporangium aliadipatigenens]